MTEQLIEIIDLAQHLAARSDYQNDRETAISRLENLKSGTTRALFLAAAKGLTKEQREILQDLSECEVSRRKRQTNGSFKVGDFVSHKTGFYLNLKGLTLKIVEFRDDWVVCLKPNGHYTFALVLEDLELVG